MGKLRVGVSISGHGSNLHALMKACAGKTFPAEITVVISNNPNAKGLKVARSAGIPHHVINNKKYQTREQFDNRMTKVFESEGIELICLAGFMRILSKSFCEYWHNKIINVHPSILPAFKGLNAPASALLSGARFTGCTVHYVREKMDSGPIIIQSVVPILPKDNLRSLSERIQIEEHQIFPEAVRLIAEKKISLLNEKVVITKHPYFSKSFKNPSISEI